MTAQEESRRLNLGVGEGLAFVTADRPEVKEKGDPLPAVAGRVGSVCNFHQPFDDEPGRLDCIEVSLQRPMAAGEGHA